MPWTSRWLMVDGPWWLYPEDDAYGLWTESHGPVDGSWSMVHGGRFMRTTAMDYGLKAMDRFIKFKLKCKFKCKSKGNGLFDL